ncbi:hypothetical protein TWF694_009605 [Orbilia ellipsospora]|uniref:Uncharacterized protein n=1 Tax=Orbilia ellipsospora TaxID=2528407 RepID=A0AAV9XBB2_9PEZI
MTALSIVESSTAYTTLVTYLSSLPATTIQLQTATATLTQDITPTPTSTIPTHLETLWSSVLLHACRSSYNSDTHHTALANLLSSIQNTNINNTIHQEEQDPELELTPELTYHEKRFTWSTLPDFNIQIRKWYNCSPSSQSTPLQGLTFGNKEWLNFNAFLSLFTHLTLTKYPLKMDISKLDPLGGDAANDPPSITPLLIDRLVGTDDYEGNISDIPLVGDNNKYTRESGGIHCCRQDEEGGLEDEEDEYTPQRSAGDYSLYAIHTLRELEHGKPCADIRYVDISAAAVWVIFAGEKLYEMCKVGRKYAGNVACGGQEFKDERWRGFSVDRWKVWLAGFMMFLLMIEGDDDVGEEEQETRELIARAVGVMEARE